MGLKKHAAFMVEHTRCIYKTYAGMVRQGSFKAMPYGVNYSQLFGASVNAAMGYHQALHNILSDNTSLQMSGHRYMDMHPATLPKGWLKAENGHPATLSRDPTPHPELHSSDYANHLKRMGWKQSNRTNNRNRQTNRPPTNRGRGNRRGTQRGRGNRNNSRNTHQSNDRKRGHQNGPRGDPRNKRQRLPFWQKGDWDCAVCNIKHAKGFFCAEGIKNNKGPRRDSDKQNSSSNPVHG